MGFFGVGEARQREYLIQPGLINMLITSNPRPTYVSTVRKSFPTVSPCQFCILNFI